MDYYVYLYWRLDTNEPFYVGKGCNDRWKWLYREYNKHFNNIVNKYPIAVEIIKDNLTENEAFYWEEEIIRQLVFEYGFSIDIKDNNSTDHYCHLVNQTWGGEGVSGWTPSEETKNKISETNKGRTRTEEAKNKISEARKGKNPLENMTDEQKEERNRKISEAHKGENHPRAKSVIAIINDKIFGVFDYTKQGGEYFNCNIGHISECCKGKLKSCGKYNGYKIVWRYLTIIEL